MGLKRRLWLSETVVWHYSQRSTKVNINHIFLLVSVKNGNVGAQVHLVPDHVLQKSAATLSWVLQLHVQLPSPTALPEVFYWHRSIGTTTMSKYRLASSASSSSHPVVKICLRIRRCCHWWEGIFCITTRMIVMLCLERERAGHQKGQCKIQSCLVQMLGSTQISSDCC